MTAEADSNYVFVDEDFDVIRVYDNHGEVATREFTVGNQATRRANAEMYAEHLALQLECEWGTNYP